MCYKKPLVSYNHALTLVPLSVTNLLWELFLRIGYSCSIRLSLTDWSFPTYDICVSTLTLYCSPYHSPGLSSRSVPSDAQLHLSGTHYLHSSSTAALWQPSNLGWKLTFSVYLSNIVYTSDWPHHIPASTSEVTTSWRYKSLYYYYYYYYVMSNPLLTQCWTFWR